MNAERASPRRGRLRARHLFFAAALLIVVGSLFVARGTDTTLVPYGSETFGGWEPPPECATNPNAHAFACIPVPPIVRPGGTTVVREAHYRVGVVFAGASLALLVAGIGLAVDRR